MSFPTTSVVDPDYTGLPAAAMFASRQKRAVGVDVSQHAIETINREETHVMEPDLTSVVRTTVEQDYLSATAILVEASAYLIAMSAPFKGRREPDMVFAGSAAKSIASALKKGSLVIPEPTLPVGSTEQMIGWPTEVRPDLSFS